MFEEPLEKDHECPICLDVQREAHLTKCCGNHFCFLCIARVVRDAKHCPICNEDPPLVIFPNKDRQRKIKSLRVRCQYILARSSPGTAGSDTRCAWQGELRDFETHRHCEDESAAAPSEYQQLQREACGSGNQATVGGSATGYRRVSSQEYEDAVALLKAALKQNSGPLTGSASAVDGMGEDLSRLTLYQVTPPPNKISQIPQNYIQQSRGAASVPPYQNLIPLLPEMQSTRLCSAPSAQVAPWPQTSSQASCGLPVVQRQTIVIHAGGVHNDYISHSSTNACTKSNVVSAFGVPKCHQTRTKSTGGHQRAQNKGANASTAAGHQRAQTKGAAAGGHQRAQTKGANASMAGGHQRAQTKGAAAGGHQRGQTKGANASIPGGHQRAQTKGANASTPGGHQRAQTKGANASTGGGHQRAQTKGANASTGGGHQRAQTKGGTACTAGGFKRARK